jgi:recombination protein RecA
MFGSPETTPGGRALKFYSSARVDVRKIATLKEGDETVGIRVKARVVKNKVAPPFRVAEFDMLGRCGISMSGDVLDMATEDRIVQKSGSWFSYDETRLGQGRDKARLFLEENPELLEEIRVKVLTARGYTHILAPPAEAESATDTET